MDYYNLLGVRRDAHAAEIRTAFRGLAKRAHPDTHPNLSGEEKVVMHRQFIQLAHAYETLSDPVRRAAYDKKLGYGPKATPGRQSGASQKQRGSPRPQSGGARTQSGASRTQSGASRNQRGAGAGHRGAARPSRPPPPPEDSADLDALMQDIQGLLDKFGLDMRHQFGEMMDQALDWALSVFVEVVAALENERADPEKSSGQPPPKEPPPRAAPSGEAPSQTGQGGEAPQPPPNLDDELAALKKQVRSTGDKKRGRAPTSESVEEALQQIKDKAKQNP